MGKIKVLLLMVLFSIPLIGFGQIEVIPINHYPANATNKTTPTNARTAMDEPIQLPFWDDFSLSVLFPDTSKWVNSENVHIGPGIGISPPSINAATFDGTDALGNVYSENPINNGKTDSLTSKPIDLSGINPVFNNSVYLSFDWQWRGFGEAPDPEDSIRLQFLDINEAWITIWKQTGENITTIDEFVQEIFQVDPAIFFNDNFQFRFQSFGNLAGEFDHWLIDYVYLNKGRQANDLFFDDSAISRHANSLFEPYTAMPRSQFFSPAFDAATKVNNTWFEFFNLRNGPQPMVYSAIVTDTIAGNIVDTLEFERDVTQITQGRERKLLEVRPIDVSKIDPLDSLVLETVYSLKSNDTLFVEDIVGIDTLYSDRYLDNDSIRTYFSIDEFYAYDDGSAEFGAGVNTQDALLAYQYYMYESDTITGVDMYFPNIDGNFSGVSIDIIVWKDLKNMENSIVARIPTVVKNSKGHNIFQTYDIEPAVVVKDTFYIGYQQRTVERLTVGLDTNTDTGNKMYYNVSGNWEENEDVKGSLMIRPRFGRGAVVTANRTRIEKGRKFKVFPNPSAGQFVIDGKFDSIQIYNTLGQEVQHHILHSNSMRSEVVIEQPSKGIYFLRIREGNQVSEEKLIIQ